MKCAARKPDQFSSLTITSDNKYYDFRSDYSVLSNYCNLRLKPIRKKPKKSLDINNTPSLEGVKNLLWLQLLTEELNKYHPLSKKK